MSTTALTLSAVPAVEKCVSNLLAATETTRHMFLASMALISMCPRVRDKLVEEQRQVGGS